MLLHCLRRLGFTLKDILVACNGCFLFGFDLECTFIILDKKKWLQSEMTETGLPSILLLEVSASLI